MIYVIRREESHGIVSHFNQFGKRHREDGPDLEYFSSPYKGSKFWRINGEYHRIGGPAIEYFDANHSSNNHFEWYKNGKRHRLNAPAYTNFDYKEFWQFGKLIR